MKISRRTFLAASGSAAILAGCDVNRLANRFGLSDEPVRFGAVPVSDHIDEATHVLNRLTYGPRPGEYDRVLASGIDAFIDEQLAPQSIDDADCEWRVRRLEAIHAPAREMFEYKEAYLRSQLEEATLLRAVYSKRQLNEVMTGFWSDHFNIALSKGDCAWLKPSDDREVIRKHALGTFPDLLRATALSPAMLWYLDGRENRKASPEEQPNENYARELLELHTLGVHGGYSQQDVMEVARCLTGWTVVGDDAWFGRGKVEFKPEWHDDGEKFVLGERIPAGGGEADLDRVLDIVSTHPSTAKYVGWKLARKFVDTDPPAEAVDAAADAFTHSGGDIPATLRALFATQTFRETRGNKFKRPFRFLASALRASAADTDEAGDVLEYATRMGHMPFQYPTPDGYPEEAGPWMGTLMWRWHFADKLARNGIGGTSVQWDDLRGAAGGSDALAAHVLGRIPTETERQLMEDSGCGPAALLASPGFQRC